MLARQEISKLEYLFELHNVRMHEVSVVDNLSRYILRDLQNG